MNVFRKRLRAEFGQKSYRHFVIMCREEMKENNPLDEIETDGKEVYREMCERIREWTPEEIAKKKERLAGISDRTSVQFCVSVLYRGECRTDRHGTATGCDQCQSGTDRSVLFVQGIRVCLQPFLLCGRIPDDVI